MAPQLFELFIRQAEHEIRRKAPKSESVAKLYEEEGKLVQEFFDSIRMSLNTKVQWTDS